MNEQQQFLLMIEAAIIDAAENGNLTQFQTTYTPPGQITAKVLRVLVVPDDPYGPRDGKVSLGHQGLFLNKLIDAFGEVATKRNHLGYRVIRQVICSVSATSGKYVGASVKVRFIVAPEEMDVAMNPHMDPRVGD